MGKNPQIHKCVLQWAKAPGLKFEFGPMGLAPLAIGPKIGQKLYIQKFCKDL
jgi:hypothetical protein